jgi:hypothetical protein
VLLDTAKLHLLNINSSRICVQLMIFPFSFPLSPFSFPLFFLFSKIIKPSNENFIDLLYTDIIKKSESDLNTSELWITFGKWLGFENPTRRVVRRHNKNVWRKIKHDDNNLQNIKNKIISYTVLTIKILSIL